jgi:hypothetical protein
VIEIANVFVGVGVVSDLKTMGVLGDFGLFVSFALSFPDKIFLNPTPKSIRNIKNIKIASPFLGLTILSVPSLEFGVKTVCISLKNSTTKYAVTGRNRVENITGPIVFEVKMELVVMRKAAIAE